MTDMQEPVLIQGDTTLWWIALIAVILVALVVLFFWFKGRRLPGPHAFRASRWSRGNMLLPTQVVVSPGSVLHYKPELFGGREQSIHINHISSVLIDRNLFFSDVMIETSGGTSAVRCHGHRKRDAIKMKELIEQFQSAYYRGGDKPARANRRATGVSLDPNAPRRAGRRAARSLPDARAVAVARRTGQVSVRPPIRNLRRPGADAGVRTDAARHSELRR